MEGLIYIHEHWHSNQVVNEIFKFITKLGDTGFIWICLAVIFLCFRKTRKTAIVMLCSLGVGFLINDFVLKNIFERVRPFNEFEPFKDFLVDMNIEFPSGFSFPSGHSYSSFNCAMVITLMHKKKGAVSLALASLIAFSRVFLLVHYPTDVLAGMILGVITAVCSYYIYKKIIKTIKTKRRSDIRR